MMINICGESSSAHPCGGVLGLPQLDWKLRYKHVIVWAYDGCVPTMALSSSGEYLSEHGGPIDLRGVSYE
jgi:hypothetical protein